MGTLYMLVYACSRRAYTRTQCDATETTKLKSTVMEAWSCWFGDDRRNWWCLEQHASERRPSPLEAGTSGRGADAGQATPPSALDRQAAGASAPVARRGQRGDGEWKSAPQPATRARPDPRRRLAAERHGEPGDGAAGSGRRAPPAADVAGATESAPRSTSQRSPSWSKKIVRYAEDELLDRGAAGRLSTRISAAPRPRAGCPPSASASTR